MTPGAVALRTGEARRGRHALSFGASFVLLAALVVGLVSLQALVAQTSFRMESLEDRAVELEQENATLILQVAQLSSPARISREAERMGLRLPEPGQVQPLRIRSSGQGEGGR